MKLSMQPEFKQTFIQEKAYENVRNPEGTYILWSRHAIQELVADGLKRAQVERALQSCEVIEDYPVLHRPLPDCLVLAWLSIEEPIHAVVAIDEEKGRIFIVTVYRPDIKEWKNGWRTRK